MSDYRRTFRPGGTFFFTVVTYGRFPIFRDEPAIHLLQQCANKIMATYPFTTEAFVVMPDHLHTIWTMPERDSDFSIRWRLIKSAFSRRYQGRQAKDISDSLRRKEEKGVWQRRFWEHMIRDQDDFNRTCDYIHYNTVKHGLVSVPSQWQHSSFKEFVHNGSYEPNWGQSASKELRDMELE